VRAELERIEADTGDPLADKAGVLTCREAMTVAAATCKQELAPLPASLPKAGSFFVLVFGRRQ
jgi:hypothetical protein